LTDWLEVALRVDGEAAEAAAELLQRYGYQGVALEQEGIEPDKLDDDEVPPAQWLILRAYVPLDAHVEERKAKLEAALGYMSLLYPMPTPAYRVVAESDWAEAWKAHYHPVRIGRRLLIRPLWIEVTPQSDDLVIALDPGMAFGTGTHPTTHLCLEALEDLVQPGAYILDLGCGSGILGIGALKLGATAVLGVDIDPIAVEVTRENAAQNGVGEAFTVAEGSLEMLLDTGGQFDLVVANILAKVIIAMCAQGLGRLVRPGGHAIFSGIIDVQADDVEVALRLTGLTPYHRRQMGDWVVIEARADAVSGLP
jgi:ribosomal protein L11 methyltransferase